MVYTLCVNLKNKGYPPKTSTNLKFKENNSQQFTSPCNVNHRKCMTLQSNVTACEIGKSHMAFSHGKTYLTPVEMWENDDTLIGDAFSPFPQWWVPPLLSLMTQRQMLWLLPLESGCCPGAELVLVEESVKIQQALRRNNAHPHDDCSKENISASNTCTFFFTLIV
jgi:hypothetical protein